MKAAKNYIKEIKSHFHNAVNLQHNCKIYIATIKGNSWSFYFKKGNLVWASSSIHRFRRLYRLTNQICPEVNCQTVKLREQEISELWEYLLISVLYKRKLITIIQVQEVIQAIIQEVLFDCFIAESQIAQVKVIFETKGNQMAAILKSPLFQQPITQINCHKILDRLESSVSNWKNITESNFSPNVAPVIKDIDKLKKAVNHEIYEELFIFIDGNKTLRELAHLTKQELLVLVNILLPQIKNKAIALQKVPDRQLANLYFSPSSQSQKNDYNHGKREYIQELDLPLVVCVDDDFHVCQAITQILNPIGYRLLAVNDPFKALMVLLENPASLIFISAEMTDANGYELCSQIKKMPALKDIPLVILRDKEGMVERLRGKLSGAVDFINKPLNISEVLTITQKHTQHFVEPNAVSF